MEAELWGGYYDGTIATFTDAPPVILMHHVAADYFNRPLEASTTASLDVDTYRFAGRRSSNGRYVYALEKR